MSELDILLQELFALVTDDEDAQAFMAYNTMSKIGSDPKALYRDVYNAVLENAADYTSHQKCVLLAQKGATQVVEFVNNRVATRFVEHCEEVAFTQ